MISTVFVAFANISHFMGIKMANVIPHLSNDKWAIENRPRSSRTPQKSHDVVRIVGCTVEPGGQLNVPEHLTDG